MEKLDVISEVLSALHIRSDLYFRAQLRSPSAVAVPQEARRIRFHVVLQGGCWVEVPGGTPVLLGEGDIALIPNGSAQVLSTDGHAPPRGLGDLVGGGALKEGVLTAGHGVVRAVLLCGFCQFDEQVAHPVLAHLPPLIHLRHADLGAEPWVAATLRLLSLEAGLNAQGTTAILGRLIEIVVIQAVRRLTADPGAGASPFIAALAEPGLSQALLAMHRTPERDWRVGDLAQLAGMSRASFADRFTAMVGVPPIEYLTDWRLLRARGLLADTDLSIDEIAGRCGYASLPSFTRRFKARFAMGPGTFRRQRRSA